jgi:hypothetical protein
MSSGLVTTGEQTIVACLISFQLLRRGTEKLHEICQLTANVSGKLEADIFPIQKYF